MGIFRGSNKHYTLQYKDVQEGMVRSALFVWPHYFLLLENIALYLSLFHFPALPEFPKDIFGTTMLYQPVIHYIIGTLNLY